MTIWHSTAADGQISTQESILWDRKRDGGFPGMFHFHVSLITCPPSLIPRYLGRVWWTSWLEGARVLCRLTANRVRSIEVKALKSLVRNVIAPERDLGHTDRALKAQQGEQKEMMRDEEAKRETTCEDCQ